MAAQPTQFVGVVTGASPFVTLNLAEALAGAGFARSGLTELQIIPLGAGNLTLSTDSAIEAEATGLLVPAGGVQYRASGIASDLIQASELYLFSATAEKAFSVYARALP